MLFDETGDEAVVDLWIGWRRREILFTTRVLVRQDRDLVMGFYLLNCNWIENRFFQTICICF